MKEILEWSGLDYEIDNNLKWDRKELEISWPLVIVQNPRWLFDRVVQNRINKGEIKYDSSRYSEEDNCYRIGEYYIEYEMHGDKKRQKVPDKLELLIQFHYKYKDRVGVFSVPTTIEWRYDKTYKYGDITKDKVQFMYEFLNKGKRMNGWLYIDSDESITFIREFVMKNQYGRGGPHMMSNIMESLNDD